MGSLTRRNPIRDYREPPIQGNTAEDVRAIPFRPNYAELKPPATSYTHSTAPVHSLDPVPSVASGYGRGAVTGLVDSRFHRPGHIYAYSHGARPSGIPQYAQSPQSSKFNPLNVNLFDYFINKFWYICYPAATVMNGGMHNLALSERTPQITTRTTGGPGTPSTRMTAKPYYTKTQNVPRYSTLPQSYNTTSAPG